jgi:hypothetical protein
MSKSITYFGSTLQNYSRKTFLKSLKKLSKKAERKKKFSKIVDVDFIVKKNSCTRSSIK